MKKPKRQPHFSRDNILYLKEIEKKLKQKKIRSASAEAETLIRHFGKISRVDLYAGERSLPTRVRRSVQKALNERAKGTPLSYLLKKANFFGAEFYVNSETLIPRPETEILAEEALSILEELYPASKSSPKILDVGTGTGCLAVSLTIKRPDSRMTALDVSPKTLAVTRKNLESHGLSKKIRLVESDLFEFFGEKEREAWDMIVSNPPYIPTREIRGLSKEVQSEPKLALDGGPDGLKLVRALLEKAPYFLKKGGWLLIEIGKGHSQVLAKRILKGGVFGKFRFVKDALGVERVLVVQK